MEIERDGDREREGERMDERGHTLTMKQLRVQSSDDPPGSAGQLSVCTHASMHTCVRDFGLGNAPRSTFITQRHTRLILCLCLALSLSLSS